MVKETKLFYWRSQNLKYKDSMKNKEVNKLQIQKMRSLLRKELINWRD